MGGPVNEALIFLVQVLFGLYGMVVVLRMLLRMARADYYNPFVQVIVKLTNKPVKLFKKILPDIKKVEMASVGLFVVLEIIKLLLICMLNARSPNFAGLAVWAVADLFSQVIQLLFYLVIIRVIMSWINPHNEMINHVLAITTNPLMRPAKRLIPPIGGTIDLSPLVVILGLQLISILFVNPFVKVGMALALH